MADTFKPTPADNYSSSSETYVPLSERSENSGEGAKETSRALLVGLLGGVLSAAGYMVYQRLPDEHKERLQGQVRSMVQSRISELRENFNI